MIVNAIDNMNEFPWENFFVAITFVLFAEAAQLKIGSPIAIVDVHSSIHQAGCHGDD